ncbi:hypothetical protein [Falsiroseomonas sp.]|uniref:hypothetical protein n=1 Tax=Falsiroseomonas sp. TaxID=2870721 RepID=UPI0027231736|nr:hypothetical protein [Falsiroseomonas sp.]MDO9502772.1 hypothetical protein [Falsiroseomonas sp.]
MTEHTPAPRRTRTDWSTRHTQLLTFLRLSPTYAMAERLAAGEAGAGSGLGAPPPYFSDVQRTYGALGAVHCIDDDEWEAKARRYLDGEAEGWRMVFPRTTMQPENLALRWQLIVQVVGGRHYRQPEHLLRVWNRLWQSVPLRDKESITRGRHPDGRKKRLDLADGFDKTEARREAQQRLLDAYRIAENAARGRFPSAQPLDGEPAMREWLLTPAMHARIRAQSAWEIEQEKARLGAAGLTGRMTVAEARHIHTRTAEEIVQQAEMMSRAEAIEQLKLIDKRRDLRRISDNLVLRDALRARLQRETG